MLPWVRSIIAELPAPGIPDGPLVRRVADVDGGGGIYEWRRVWACIHCWTHESGRMEREQFETLHARCTETKYHRPGEWRVETRDAGHTEGVAP